MIKKRILLSAYAFYPEFGGLEQQMYLLAQEFIKLGHSVTVLTEKPDINSPQTEIIDSIRVHRLPYSKGRSVIDYVRLIVSLCSYIIAHRKDFDVAYLRSALTLYPLIFSILKFFKCIAYPVSVTADTGGENDEISIVKRWPLYQVMVFFFKSLNSFNSICEANYDHYLELGIPESKITRISNGIHIDTFQKASYPSRVTNFIFLGRFIKEKGLYELVDAVKIVKKIFPDFKLYIAGDGAEKNALFSKIRAEDLQSTIIYKGVVSGKAKEAFLGLGECLVLPSYSEGLPGVVLEAAARKKIILSTRVGDLETLFSKNILFCKKRSSADLAKMMLIALRTNFSSTVDYSVVVSSVDIKRTSKQYLVLFK
jgi:glycosyltransferase involved in cell wall biosynthesis